jgi:hypothetical protein
VGRARYLFDQAAARYLDEYPRLASIEDVALLLARVMPNIGHLYLDQMHDETLRPFVQARLKLPPAQDHQPRIERCQANPQLGC